MKKYFKIFSSQGSLKRSFCLFSGYLVIFAPVYLFYINAISGEFLCNHLYACAVTFSGFYLGGRIHESLTTGRTAETETKSTTFSGPVEPPKIKAGKK